MPSEGGTMRANIQGMAGIFHRTETDFILFIAARSGPDE
jgi:hypothetical protein